MFFTSSRPIASGHKIETIGELSHVVGDPSGLWFAVGSTVIIHSWGKVPFSSMERMFDGCDVKILCDESPVFAPGCTLRGMFCFSNINQNLRWDTSEVTDMSSMFLCCSDLNQIFLWNTSKVTDMSDMFARCEILNQGLHFDTSKVTDMRAMFVECTSFDQGLHFDTSKVTDMSHMFRGCTSLNQGLHFDTSKVTGMSNMFHGCAASAGISRDP